MREGELMDPIIADPAPEAERMAAAAGEAAAYLKSLGHEQRLMILCHLASGERTVGEIEALLGARQAAVSQQLARLRFEGLVEARREGKTVLYSLADDRARRLVGLLYELFCPREP
jgi:DNA-binding transcriptional ArsR family regulator